MFKKLYNDVKNTFYNKALYGNIEKIGLSHPFWLFVKLSMVSAIVFVLVALPSVFSFVEEASELTSKNYFPPELEIVIKDGVATTNLTEEPYYISSDILKEEHRPEEAQNLILINTTEDLKLSDVANEDVFLIVARDSFVFRDEDDTRVVYYESFLEEEFTINKENADALVSALMDKLPLAIALLSVFAVVFLSIAGIFAWLAITLVLSVIAIVINKTRNLGLNYRNVYKMSMYAAVPAIVVDILTDIFVGLTSFSFLVSAAIFTVVLVWNTQPKSLESID